jgi:DNA-binding FadR family transcriptional regulator
MTATAATALTDRVKLDLQRLMEVLQTGDRLPPVEQLCIRFGVSRTVVREAIASLKAEGRLRSRRGSGVFVSEPPSRDLPALFMSAPQEIGDVLDLMEFRISVETEAAALAAERRTETHLMRIAQAMAQFDRPASAGGLASEADRAFHRAIAEATGNRRFVLFVDDMGERLIPRRALGARFADEKSQAAFLEVIAAEHRQIYEAIADKRAEEARRAMRQHLEGGRRRYREWRLAHDLEDAK